jgi:hypothetical protein
VAKPIVVSLEGIESSFDHAKVERARLYGARRRLPLDSTGEACIKAALTTDGLYLLQAGMTAQGYFDESGRWWQKNQLVGLDSDGQALPPRPSTLGLAQVLEPVAPLAVLACAVDAVYGLDPLSIDETLQARLTTGQVYRFDFNYTADFHQGQAFLLKNAEGFFCLVGTPLTVAWSEPGKVAAVAADDDAADELDFEMF